MENEAIVSKDSVLSKEEKELERKKKNNIKLYPIYRMFSWDLIFYYAIIYLFLTLQKKITPAQVLQFDAFYILFRFLLQIPCTLIIQKIGKRDSLLLANAIAIVHMLFIIFAKNFEMLIFSQLLCAFAFIIRGTCETDMLYDSLQHNEKRGSTFAKIDGKATSRYYYIDAISAILSGFLYVVNPYIPMVLSLITLTITYALTLRFEDIQPKKGKMQIREEIKTIRLGFRNIFISKRLRSLLIFNSLFVALIKILQNIRNTVLIEIGMPEQYFGIIFATMGIITGISARNQGRIHNRFRNRTLTFLSLPLSFSCLIIGYTLLSNLPYELKLIIILTMFALQYAMKGPYYTLIKRYFNNFTTSDKRIKISTANNLCENAIASALIFAAAEILAYIKIQYTIIIVGCIASIGFLLLLDHMRKTVGLKPEEYSKKEIL